MRDSMLRFFTNPPTVTSHNIKIEYSLLILELSTHMLLITFIIVSVVGITKLRSQVPRILGANNMLEGLPPRESPSTIHLFSSRKFSMSRDKRTTEILEQKVRYDPDELMNALRWPKNRV